MAIFLSLEICDQKIRHVIIEKKGKEKSFKGTGVSTLKVDASIPGVLTNFINDLISSSGLKINSIFLTINRRDVLVRQISLPKTSKEDLDLIVPGEIEKTSIFADTDYDYIFHEYPSDDINKTRLVFAAITDEFLKFLLDEVKETQIPLKGIEVVPLNVVGLLSSDKFKNTPQSLIVLSDRMSHLIVFENQQVKYLYSTNVGQESLTTDLMRSTWAEEFKRVYKAYALESKTTITNESWLIWDNEKDPSLLDQLQKSSNFNVKPLNILEDWTGIDVNPIYFLACVPAMYLLDQMNPQFPLNHFLKGFHFQGHIRKVAVLCMTLFVLSVVVFGAGIYHFSKIKQHSAIEVQGIQNQIADLEKKSPEIFKLRDEYAKTREQLLFQATYVKLLNRMSWSETLAVVAGELPEELSLTSFKVSDSGQVTFTGEAFRMESVAQMLRKVETSAILKQGKFNYLTQGEVNKRKIFTFGILASMKLGDES